MNYQIYYKSQKLNLKFCENISYEISTPANFENLGIDMKKLNYTMNLGIDIFNSSSEFFNDICSTFSTENGTDIIIKDRQKDYYQNVTLCPEKCVYNGFDRVNNKINCDCNNNNIDNNNKKKFGNEVNNLFSNSNLKVLKCLYLNKNYKIFFKNYGNYIFFACEIGEIILFFNILLKGFFPLVKNLKNIKKNIY